jgi:hypothetical protein
MATARRRSVGSAASHAHSAYSALLGVVDRELQGAGGRPHAVGDGRGDDAVAGQIDVGARQRRGRPGDRDPAPLVRAVDGGDRLDGEVVHDRCRVTLDHDQHLGGASVGHVAEPVQSHRADAVAEVGDQ